MTDVDAFYRGDLAGEAYAIGDVLREALAISELSAESFGAYVAALADTAASQEPEDTRETYRAQWARAFRYAVHRERDSVVKREERRAEAARQKAAGEGWWKKSAKVGYQ